MTFVKHSTHVLGAQVELMKNAPPPVPCPGNGPEDWRICTGNWNTWRLRPLKTRPLTRTIHVTMTATAALRRKSKRLEG